MPLINAPNSIFHPLVPGSPIPGDWFPHSVPSNIVVGEGTVIDSLVLF